MQVTTDWWKSVNPNQDVYLPLQTVKKLFVAKKLTQDLDTAEKVIFRFVGKVEDVEYSEFYTMFTKGIFRVALQDMMANIESLSENGEGLPLPLKLGAYRRNLMLSGLDKSDSVQKDRGKQILYALKIYKENFKPELFKDLDFKKYVLDPLGRNKKLEGEALLKDNLKKYSQTVKFKRIKKLGSEQGINTLDIEKKLRGEDDETQRELVKEI